MNRRFVFLSAFAAVLLVSVVGFAQRPGQGGQRGQRGMGMGRGMGMAQLLRVEAVQKEIAITSEQTEKVGELMAAGRGQGGARADFQNMTDEERQKFRDDMAKRQAEQDKKLAEILNEDQLKRLHQIRIQAMGSMAFMNEDVAKELGITEEQQGKMREAGQAVREEMRDAAQGGGQEAMAKMMEKLNAKMMELLTDKQKATFKEMVGKPFDIAQLRGGRGGRGGGRGN